MSKRTQGPSRTRISIHEPWPTSSTLSLPEPERIVGLGFRLWFHGRKRGDISCWERAWSLYTGVFGLCGARLAVGALSGWVTALDGASNRDIEVYPDACSTFCRDECLAISMIAASQHETCPALRACAFALMECSSVDRVVGEARAFADVMTGLEQRLSPDSIVKAPIRVPKACASTH